MLILLAGTFLSLGHVPRSQGVFLPSNDLLGLRGLVRTHIMLGQYQRLYTNTSLPCLSIGFYCWGFVLCLSKNYRSTSHSDIARNLSENLSHDYSKVHHLVQYIKFYCSLNHEQSLLADQYIPHFQYHCC